MAEKRFSYAVDVAMLHHHPIFFFFSCPRGIPFGGDYNHADEQGCPFRKRGLSFFVEVARTGWHVASPSYRRRELDALFGRLKEQWACGRRFHRNESLGA